MIKTSGQHDLDEVRYFRSGWRQTSAPSAGMGWLDTHPQRRPGKGDRIVDQANLWQVHGRGGSQKVRIASTPYTGLAHPAADRSAANYEGGGVRTFLSRPRLTLSDRNRRFSRLPSADPPQVLLATDPDWRLSLFQPRQ